MVNGIFDIFNWYKNCIILFYMEFIQKESETIMNNIKTVKLVVDWTAQIIILIKGFRVSN